MKRTTRILFLTLGLILLGLLVWYFSAIVFYVITAGILSLIGKPAVYYLDRIKVFKFGLPHGLNAAVVLLLMVVVFGGLLLLFVPMVVQQGRVISAIDLNTLVEGLKQPLAQLSETVHGFGILKPGESIESLVMEKASGLINVATFSNMFGSIVGVAGSFVTFVFSVLFLAYFFLRDDKLFLNSLLLFVPSEFEQRTTEVLHQVKALLTRYFIGLCLQILTMTTLITIGLWIFGAKNALLIGFFAGLMVVIPYLGPIIGSVMGVLLTVLDCLAQGWYDAVLPMGIRVAGVFLVANLIDNILVQPLIYSNSVKAHPIEIFLVIIMAGSLAGITGMILAIPVYTILRIAAKEFLGKFDVVKKLTKNI